MFAGFQQEAKQQNGDHLRKRHNLKSASSKYTEMQNRPGGKLKMAHIFHGLSPVDSDFPTEKPQII